MSRWTSVRNILSVHGHFLQKSGDTDTHTGPIALPVPLEWSVKGQVLVRTAVATTITKSGSSSSSCRRRGDRVYSCAAAPEMDWVVVTDVTTPCREALATVWHSFLVLKDGRFGYLETADDIHCILVKSSLHIQQECPVSSSRT